MHPKIRIPIDIANTIDTQEGLVSTAQLIEAGLSPSAVRGLIQRRELRRLTTGVYAVEPPEARPRSWAARRRRAAWIALLAYGPKAVAVGACALALHRVEGLPTTITPEVAVPRGRHRRPRDGIRARPFDDGMRMTRIHGRHVATLEWALAQAIPELPHRFGLAVLDSVMRTHRLTPHAVEIAHDLARGRRGIGSRHQLWDLADARAESPLESFARWECIAAGLPPHVLQLAIRTERGQVIAQGDMAWLRTDGRWLIAEFDGRDVHAAPEAVYADRNRQNILVGSGAVDLLRFTGRDLGRIAPTVRRALGRTGLVEASPTGLVGASRTRHEVPSTEQDATS